MKGQIAGLTGAPPTTTRIDATTPITSDRKMRSKVLASVLCRMVFGESVVKTPCRACFCLRPTPLSARVCRASDRWTSVPSPSM